MLLAQVKDAALEPTICGFRKTRMQLRVGQDALEIVWRFGLRSLSLHLKLFGDAAFEV
jgi:hypothetical protein